ncbi:MAG: 3-oxoacyl-[acyl-carrier-protein] reductase [Alphaproteobacteria bacterium]|nr:3-oxoacyl-[acyl-carrier-protein] reductase [Alphaproteobacteria bacterium]
MFSLSGKTALVTGASGGIGSAVAKALAAQGAKLALSGTRADALQHLASEIGGVALPCDLSSPEAVDALIPQAETALGQVDILICNAGLTKDGLALRMKLEEWDQVLRVNLSATFQLNKAALKGMLKRRAGRIINMASVVAVMGNPGQANYCASKAGMIGMTKSLAQEVASRNVTVNCIAPGFIETAMTGALTEDQKSRITQNIPLGRMGAASDIAAAAVFLASEEAAYITGQTLHVNGGLLMV